MFTRIASFTFACAALLPATSAWAQYQYPNRRTNTPQAMPISKKGTVYSVGNGVLTMKEGDKPVMVGVNSQTEIHVTGTAEPNYLGPKMFVEFVADISATGEGKDKIDKLSICSPTSDHPAGLSDPLPQGDKKKDKNNKNAPAAAAPGKGAFDSGFDQGTSKSKTHVPAPKLPGTFTVRGIVKSYKNGRLMVSTGHGPVVKVEVSDTAAIDVDTSDMRGVSQGDKVTVKGQGIQNRVMAESISIELSSPLTGVKKKTTHEKPLKVPPKSDS